MTRRPRGRHAWRGAHHRNAYTLIWSRRRRGWVRLVSFDGGDCVVLDLDNRVLTGSEGS